MTLKTEFKFTLPKGYVTDSGVVHREGVMRLATAADEIEPLRDPRVRENEAFLTVIVLSRVVTTLGNLKNITPNIVEGLFAADLAYLQDFYSIVNFGNPDDLENLESGESESSSPLADSPQSDGG